MRLGQRLHTLILELYSDGLRLQIKIWTLYWNYNFGNNASDLDYGFRFGLQLQIEIRTTDWDLDYRLGLQLQIEITNTDWDFAYRLGLQIQIEIWATDWDYGYRLEFGLQIGIWPTDLDCSYRLGLGLQIGVICSPNGLQIGIITLEITNLGYMLRSGLHIEIRAAYCD